MTEGQGVVIFFYHITKQGVHDGCGTGNMVQGNISFSETCGTGWDLQLHSFITVLRGKPISILYRYYNTVSEPYHIRYQLIRDKETKRLFAKSLR
jgi:hypothetical protein